MAVNTLTPQQLINYQQQRNQYGQNLGRSKAGNLYQQQLNNMLFGRDQRSFNRTWDQKRVALPTGFLQRGLGRSGIYQGALQNYAKDRATGFSDLALNNQLRQAGLIFTDRGYEDEYANDMAANYARQYADQAQAAAALRRIL